jgi:nitroreductase/NAD-dependent dihydropyrimidine dehydrogenase PreA subunit
MGLLIIDKEKCKQDGLCAADCPVAIIRFDGKGSYPQLVPHGEQLCLRCGHCVAVCPHGAIDHAEIPLAQCPPIEKALALSQTQAEQFLRSRRSVRQFKAKAVPRATLQRLIEVARYAPTGSNSQLLEWRVISDKARLRELAGQVIEWMRGVLKDPAVQLMPYIPRLVKAWEAGEDSILRSAPCLVTAMAPAQARNGMVELALALSYLELAAPLYGLGTCWAGLLQGAMQANPAVKQAAGVPAGYPYFYPMMIGHSKVRYHRLPQRKAPRITWN